MLRSTGGRPTYGTSLRCCNFPTRTSALPRSDTLLRDILPGKVWGKHLILSVPECPVSASTVKAPLSPAVQKPAEFELTFFFFLKSGGISWNSLWKISALIPCPSPQLPLEALSQATSFSTVNALMGSVLLASLLQPSLGPHSHTRALRAWASVGWFLPHSPALSGALVFSHLARL